MMQYKVQGNILPTHIMPEGEHPVKATVISRWVDADSPLDAAADFLMDNDKVNASPILVVDSDYNIGNYPLDYVKIAIDYRVGLRERSS
mgnify:FL=1|jgi:hypothetical protein